MVEAKEKEKQELKRKRREEKTREERISSFLIFRGKF